MDEGHRECPARNQPRTLTMIKIVIARAARRFGSKMQKMAKA